MPIACMQPAENTKRSAPQTEAAAHPATKVARTGAAAAVPWRSTPANQPLRAAVAAATDATAPAGVQNVANTAVPLNQTERPQAERRKNAITWQGRIVTSEV